MLINHLIVGCHDVKKSTQFYCDYLDFKETNDDPGAKNGQVLTQDNCELLLIQFPDNMLPNPAHFAVEVADRQQFESILEKARIMELSPRSMPPKNSKPGTHIFTRDSVTYELFYVDDPNGVTLEVMVKV